MQKKIKSPNHLKVSLHGMNDRMQKMMTQYLESYCKNIALVVKGDESQAEIVDIDLADSKRLLSERLAQVPQKPVIALSVQDVLFDSVIYVKKPIDKPSMVNAINKITQNIKKQSRKSHFINLSKNTAPENKPKSPKYNLEAQIQVTPTDTQPVPNKIKKDVPIHLKKSTIKPTESSLLEFSNKKKVSKKPESTIQSREIDLSSNALSIETEKTHIIEEPIKISLPSALRDSTDQSEVSLLLEELHTQPPKLHLSENRKNLGSQEKSRKAIRYAFQPIKAKLEKKSLIGLSSTFSTLILNISSKGAIIKLKNSSKIQGKLTLTIHFDSQHIFIIPSKVVRKEQKNTYAIQFMDNQHELTDFLIESGHSFTF